MFEKSEATEPSQERKITTAVGKAKRPKGMQRISEMKKICAIKNMCDTCDDGNDGNYVGGLRNAEGGSF